MGRTAFVLAVAALAAVVPAAQTAPRALPAPSFTLAGALEGLAAAGSRVAVSAYCDVRVATLGSGTKPKAPPVRVRRVPCADPDAEGSVYDLWLGRRSVALELIEAPSPHGESYSLWKGPVPSGPVRQLGGSWGWRDDNPDEAAHGCEGVVVSGGGVIASTRVPNRFGVANGLTKKPECASSGTTVIALDGASRPSTTVKGSWTLLATDGKRLALSRLDEEGSATGELSFVGLDGKPLETPKVAPAIVKAAGGGWLAPEGLVLSTRAGLEGPGWRLRNVYAATVAYGRVLYVKGNAIRVRRIADGVDRPLLTLPRGGGDKLVAAGSFGLAVAVQTEKAGDYRTSVYRIGWRAIDAALPQRR